MVRFGTHLDIRGVPAGSRAGQRVPALPLQGPHQVRRRMLRPRDRHRGGAPRAAHRRAALRPYFGRTPTDCATASNPRSEIRPGARLLPGQGAQAREPSATAAAVAFRPPEVEQRQAADQLHRTSGALQKSFKLGQLSTHRSSLKERGRSRPRADLVLVVDLSFAFAPPSFRRADAARRMLFRREEGGCGGLLVW